MPKHTAQLKGDTQDQCPISDNGSFLLRFTIWNLRALILLLMFLCIYLAPYTKVEESFNLQTIHDFVFLGPTRFKEFDHYEFPGVVPRTCLSGLLISLFVYPQHLLFKFMDSKELLDYSVSMQKFIMLFAARGVLGLSTTITWMRLGRILGRRLGGDRELWFLLFSVTQFYFLFWGSRPLPNMFALVLSNLGLGCWLNAVFTPSSELELKWKRRYLGWMVPAAVILRMECLFLAAFFFMCDMVARKRFYTWHVFFGFILYSIKVFLISLLITVIVDSVFWNGSLYEHSGMVWPEGYVFHFNAFLGKSDLWGTLPFNAYFTSFLPKALGVAYLAALYGFLQSSVLALFGRQSGSFVIRILSPALLFTGFMSNLGHKEWRFLVYIFPIFNLAASETVSNFEKRISSRPLVWAFRSLALVALGANLAFTGFSTIVSSINYPGGDALELTHKLYSHVHGISVHIDSSAAISGVSRFGEISGNWTYSKNEHLKTDRDFAQFNCLLTATPELHSSGWSTAAIAYGFEKLNLRPISSWKNSLVRLAQLGPPELQTALPQLEGLPKNHNLTPTKLKLLYWLQVLTPLHVSISPKVFVLQKSQDSFNELI